MDIFSRKTLTWLNIMFFHVVSHGLACCRIPSTRQVVAGRPFHSESESMWAAPGILSKGHPGSAVVGGLAREMCPVPEVCFPMNSSFQKKDFPLSLFNACLWDHPILELGGPWCHHCQNFTRE